MLRHIGAQSCSAGGPGIGSAPGHTGRQVEDRKLEKEADRLTSRWTYRKRDRQVDSKARQTGRARKTDRWINR